MLYKKLKHTISDVIIKTVLYWFKTYREKEGGGQESEPRNRS